MTTMYFGNEVRRFLLAAGIGVAFVLVFWLFKVWMLGYIERLAKKTHTDFDDLLLQLVRELRPWFYYAIALYLFLKTLALPGWLDSGTDSVLIAVIVVQAILSSMSVLNYILSKVNGEKREALTESAVRQIRTLGKIALWSFGLLLILSNFGINVTSLIAGLGIGGIAIAFALQNILEDLFSAFAIYFDKPFVVGDFITVGDKTGVVEKIGIKTTRIRALQGEEIVISNKRLTGSEIQNFKRLQERRISFNIGLVYETDAKRLREVPGIVEDVIKGVENVRFDRATFKQFGDSALIFEIVYYVLSQDFDVYMDAQQDINFGLHEVFSKRGLDMAFPTTTVHLVK